MQNGNDRSSYSVERTNYNDTNMRTFQRTNKSRMCCVNCDMCNSVTGIQENMMHDYCYIALIILSSGTF